MRALSTQVATLTEGSPSSEEVTPVFLNWLTPFLSYFLHSHFHLSQIRGILALRM